MDSLGVSGRAPPSVAGMPVELHVTDAAEPGLLALFEGIVERGELGKPLAPLHDQIGRAHV